MLKHKDDIRRRLTLAEVPKPPADLAQKIKHEIPRHFTSMAAKEATKKPREESPLWNFWGFSWQLAASILVLVGLTWAVFEAYRSEVNKASQVADASKDVMSVEELEAIATEEPDMVRVEGAAQAPAPSSPAPAKEQARTAAPPPAVTFAPESRSDLRQVGQAESDAPSAASEKKMDDTRFAEEGRIAVTAAAPAVAENEAARRPVADSREREPARAIVRAPAAAAPVAESVTSQGLRAKSESEAKREVVVRGLATERVIRVDLTLDGTGKVVEAVVPDVRERAVLDAIAATSKTWTFPVRTDEAGRDRLARTIEVQLRKGD